MSPKIESSHGESICSLVRDCPSLHMLIPCHRSQKSRNIMEGSDLGRSLRDLLHILPETVFHLASQHSSDPQLQLDRIANMSKDEYPHGSDPDFEEPLVPPATFPPKLKPYEKVRQKNVIPGNRPIRNRLPKREQLQMQD